MTKIPDLSKGVPDCEVEGCTRKMFGHVASVDMWVCSDHYIEITEMENKRIDEELAERKKSIQKQFRGENNGNEKH